MWEVRVKATNEQDKQTKTHRHRQQFGGYQWENSGGKEVEKGKGGKTW